MKEHEKYHKGQEDLSKLVVPSLLRSTKLLPALLRDVVTLSTILIVPRPLVRSTLSVTSETCLYPGINKFIW